MEQIVEAEYQVVQERSPEVIRTEIKTIEAQVYKTTLDGVIQIGKRLQELKEMIGHGNWLTWCRENLGYSDRQARRYIEISTEYGDENSAFSNWTTLSNLSISKAYSLLSLPENEVEAFAKEHDVEDMTVKELEAEIKSWKDKTEAAEQAAEQAKKEKEEIQECIKTEIDQRAELENKIAELESQKTNPEELKKAKEELENKKKEIEEIKEKLKEEKDKQKGEIEKEIAAQKEIWKSEAEKEQNDRIQEIEKRRKNAEEQAEKLEAKLKKLENGNMVLFKARVDMMQKMFREILDMVAVEESEQAQKMKTALTTVMEAMINQIN